MPSLKKTVSVICSAVLIASPFIAYLERQNLYDWWRLRNYDVPAEVANLATDTSMDDFARKIFYVAHPKLQDKTDFRSNCTIYEKTIILGCYRSGDGIYIYQVTDARLNGIMQVTSAHEMLHAAYERLSGKERQRVDSLTAQAFVSIADKRVIKNIDSYRERDASVVPNELHSILGTEVRTLPSELEAYYAKYFTDRSKIVSFSEQYEGEFTSREDAVAAYDSQLSGLKATIASLNSSLEAQGKQIEAESRRLDRLAQQQNIAAYNSAIPAYQRMVNAYNADIGKLKAAINTYNELVDKRNNIVTEERELMNALDSSVPTTK